MSRKIVAILSAMLLASSVALPAAFADARGGHASGHGYGYGHGSHTSHYLKHLLRHKKEIGLTEDQVGKIRTLNLEWDKPRIKSLADIQIAEREAAALSHDQKGDITAIEAKLKDAAMQEVALRMTALKTRRDAMNVLTPEQREKEKTEQERRMSHKRAAHGTPAEHTQAGQQG
jgi:periplasmic protein CpxP/Spy